MFSIFFVRQKHWSRWFSINDVEVKVTRRESVADFGLANAKAESLALNEQIREGFSLRSSGGKVFKIRETNYVQSKNWPCFHRSA